MEELRNIQYWAKKFSYKIKRNNEEAERMLARNLANKCNCGEN